MVGVGDALLLLADRYSARLVDRCDELARLAVHSGGETAAVATGYARAVAFRHAPATRVWDAMDLANEARAQWGAIARLEAHRIGAGPFGTVWDYFASPRAVFAELADVHPLARAFGGVRAAAARRIAWRAAGRHPRETLARVSMLLAYAPDRAAAHRAAASILGTPSAQPGDLARGLEHVVEIAA